MLKLTLREIGSAKGRLILTMLSIVLGVGFVAGSFMFTDTLRSTFDDLSADIFEGVDAVVQAEEGEVSSSQGEVIRFDESVVETFAEIEGVAVYEPGLSATSRVFALDGDGEVLAPQGPPVIAVSWAGPSDITTLTLEEGKAPEGPDEVALDPLSIDEAGFAIGDTITVSGPQGLDEFTLVGAVEFGAPGPYFVVFDLPTMQEVLGEPNQIESIVFGAEPGYDVDTLVAELAAAAPDGLEAISSEVAINETQEEFGSFINIFGNVLLGFALVTLFVSIFIIYNTFAILVTQRTRQMGLLRAIGASSSQVLRMVMTEAVVVGLISAVIGLGVGLGVATLLQRLILSGGSLELGTPEIRLRTVIVVLIVGVVVTVLSAIAPAFRASRISPLAALQDSGRPTRSMTFRLISGAFVLVPGVVLLGLGLFGAANTTSGVLTLLGIGSVLTFIGVAMVSALFAGPAASLLGRPVQAIRGTTGRIARDNASRSPQRTAATATALMIGLSLITAVSVLAASIKASFSELLEEALAADIFVYDEQGIPFSPAALAAVEELSEVDAAAGFSEYDAVVDGEVQLLSAYDSAAGSQLVNIPVVEGTLTLSDFGIGVLDTVAEEEAIEVGDELTVAYDDGEELTYTVEGIFEANGLVSGNYAVERSPIGPHVTVDGVGFMAVNLTDDVDAEAGQAAVEETLRQFPQLAVQSNAEFQEETEGQIDAFLQIVNGLLALCIVVAFFGIVNTMALSVMERTREIGLLRAVGMTRRQLRSSIRWEAVIVAVFGSLLGIGMGVVLAWAGIAAVPEGFFSTPTIPFGTLAVYVVIGAVLGVVAAFFPARRAAKLNVLEAIAHE
ncbi:MAG: ABC transporter permease [Acidimicrobiales bacterium]